MDEFADAVESGKDEDRPAFQRLIAALKNPDRGWEHVLVLDTSRIARRRLIAMMFEADCVKRGVRITYKSLPESDPATDMVLRSVLQAFDEYHSLISRAKGLAGMAENVRQGWRAGGRAPRGYKLEYHPTGAVRDGAPVLKSTLVVDDELAPMVQSYFALRAAGVSRGSAIERLRLPWPASSVQSMDWQALTYAGHTVWGMHAERMGGAAIGGEKRRPRAQWQTKRDTHKALITEAEAETVMRQLDSGQQGRRLRKSPRLLTGLLVNKAGEAWHSDGAGYYRVGKGRRVMASRVEAAVLGRLEVDLSSDDTVARLRSAMGDIASGTEPVDGRRLAGLEKRVTTLAAQIAKTVDLAAQMSDPAPVLRRVADLEHQRSELLEQIAEMQTRQAMSAFALEITDEEIRELLQDLLQSVSVAAGSGETCDEARAALREVLGRVELDVAATPEIWLHYAIQTSGDKVASPRGSMQSPVVLVWVSGPVPLLKKAA